MPPSTPVYSDRLVRHLVRASLVWAALAMAIGALAGLQLLWPPSHLSPELAFGRIRAVHVYAMVFGFTGNLMLAGIYYASGRLLAVTITRPGLAHGHMIGWQAVVAAVCVSMVMGYRTGDGLLGAPWLGDAAMAVLWLVHSLIVFDMIRQRRCQRLYVSVWCFMAVMVVATIAPLVAVVTSPFGPLAASSVLSGSTQAIAPAWAEGSVMAFLLIVGPMGLMYFFVPAAAQKPLYSYRLAVAQFWPMVLLLGFAGPAALVGSAAPGWLQSLVVVAGLVVVAPLVGGALAGLLTLGGTWNRLRTDASLKFFAAATVFLALFAIDAALVRAPAMASLTQYTDWMVGHAHLLGMGWFGCLAFGILYWLVPRLWGMPLRYPGLANAHVYVALVGILVHLAAAWIAGATQGAMWRAQTTDGGLAYNFVETLVAMDILRWARLGGAALYAVGLVLLVVNLGATARGGRAHEEPITMPSPDDDGDVDDSTSWRWLGGPVLVVMVLAALIVASTALNALASLVSLFLVGLVLTLWVAVIAARARPGRWHLGLERRALAMALTVAAASLASGAVMIGIGPARAGEGTHRSVSLSALELAGRMVYQSEGCRSCHSQRVRPFLWESNRYGDVSESVEKVKIHPPGSRRIGPDLARVGGRYSHRWHFDHLIDPPAVTFGSNMPSYRHLVDQKIDLLGMEPESRQRAHAIADELAVPADSRMVALIAYLQSLQGNGAADPAPGPGGPKDAVP